MPDRAATAATVYAALARLRPVAFAEKPPPEDVGLGKGGLELDSIEVAEMLIACADEIGLDDFALVDRLDGPPGTVAGVIDLLAAP